MTTPSSSAAPLDCFWPPPCGWPSQAIRILWWSKTGPSPPRAAPACWPLWSAMARRARASPLRAFRIWPCNCSILPRACGRGRSWRPSPRACSSSRSRRFRPAVKGLPEFRRWRHANFLTRAAIMRPGFGGSDQIGLKFVLQAIGVASYIHGDGMVQGPIPEDL